MSCIGTLLARIRRKFARLDSTAGGGWSSSPPRVGTWGDSIGRSRLLRSARPSRAAEGLGPETPQQPARGCGATAESDGGDLDAPTTQAPRPGPAPEVGSADGQPLPRTPRRRPAARRRRRHGRPRLERRAPRPHPRRGEPARARDRRQAPRRLHPGRRRPDRDEHVRRQPPQARRATTSRTSCTRSTAPASSSPARRARSPAATSSSPARSGRSASGACPADERIEIFAEQAAVLEGRGVDLFAVETFFDLDELESAIEAVRSVSSLPDPRHAHLRRRRRDALRASRPREAAERLRELGVAAIGANHGAGHPGRARRAQRDGRQRPPARRDAEHRPREHGRQPDHLPARLARVLRRVRRARTQPRRPRDRRLLRDDADRDRRHRLGGQGGARAERAARVRRARGRRSRCPSSARRPSSPARSARTSGSSRCRSTRRSAAATTG